MVKNQTLSPYVGEQHRMSPFTTLLNMYSLKHASYAIRQEKEIKAMYTGKEINEVIFVYR